MQLTLDPDRLASLALIPHIDFARRIFAHEHRCQTRHDGVVLNELDHLLGQFRADLLRQLLAIENFGGHESRPAYFLTPASRLRLSKQRPKRISSPPILSPTAVRCHPPTT